MSKFELRPHQLKALNELSDGKILRADVGSGKSLVGVEYYVRNHSPKPLYIITTAKKRDKLEWLEDAIKLGVGTLPGPEAHGAMTVDSWQNITKYTDVQDAFFIFDEQRVVGYGAWSKAFLKIAAKNKWIMLSATPGDVWMDYVPVFIANGFFRNKTEFVREHVVTGFNGRYPTIEGYRAVKYLESLEKAILVEMPFERHTTRHILTPQLEYSKTLYNRVLKDRWDIYKDEPIKDAAALFMALRRVVNEDPSRFEVLQSVYERHRRVIVFYNFNYELDLLREYADKNGIRYAEWNGQKHQELPEEDEWLYFVQYIAGSEGWNCVRTDAILMYSLTYSYKHYEQAQGRIDRLTTPYSDLYYYVLRSNSSIDRAIWQNLRKKMSFNERKFLAKLG